MEKIGVYLFAISAIAVLAVVVIWFFQLIKWLKDIITDPKKHIAKMMNNFEE